MTTRRQFLKTGAIVSLSSLVPGIFARTARAAVTAPDAPVLIVVQLDGGNDGLNTVVPFGDDAYGRHRNKLRLDSARLHKLDDHLGLHADMTAAKSLFDDGRLAIVQNVGYPNPDRSHFRSMRIWHTARLDDDQHDYGWLGRTLDVHTVRRPRATTSDAVYVGDQDTPLALWGRRCAAMALSRATDLHLELDALAARRVDSQTDSPALDQFVAHQVLNAYAAASEFQKRHGTPGSGERSQYPGTELGAKLQLIAQLLKSGSQARVFYAVQTGYDTHATQLFAHARLLREFADALQTLLNDLKTSGLDERVVVLAFSEFGRRVTENASQGTDHGTAGPVFLAGRQIQGGLLGDYPDLSDLDNGDLRVKVDFRQVYATLLDNWLGVPSREILGGKFDSLPILKN